MGQNFYPQWSKFSEKSGRESTSVDERRGPFSGIRGFLWLLTGLLLLAASIGSAIYIVASLLKHR
jgi:hypothetical protein